MFSAAAIIGFGKAITDVASDLTETQNVVDTAFKDSAGEIEQWSKEAINKFGLSELAAKKYASRIMAMSNSMEISHKNGLILSKNIAQLSADLASFYNTDVEGAFEALNSIFTGQIRTLRKYGLNISEANLENYRLSKGIKTAYSAMSEQQKVLLRYNYVMENTRDIQGDFAKTQITFANQTKLLQQNFKSLAGTLGSFLIPVLSTILKYLNAVIVAINSFFGRLASIAGIQLQHFGGGVGLTEDIADGWDNAAGAAAKYKATIAGFDELETLNPQSSGGGGAAGGGLSGEDLFPDGLLSYDVDDNTEALDVSFNHLLELIDNKIQEIREKTDTLASTFGKNVNGIINYVNWPLIGKTVGDGFNLVTSAVNRFMEEIDFHNLGQKFAASVNSIFDTVDFEETGHKLSLKFNAIIDTVNGFIGDLNFDSIAAGILTHFKTALAEIKWEQAGETLAMGINKVFGLLDDLLNGNIVADLGTKIGVAINTAVANIDAAQIGRVADGLAKQIIAAIKEIDWGLIGSKLREAFIEGHVLENLFDAIKTGFEIKGDFWGNVFDISPTVATKFIEIATAIGLLITPLTKLLGLIATMRMAGLGGALFAPIFSGLEKISIGDAIFGILDPMKTGLAEMDETLRIFLANLGGIKDILGNVMLVIIEHFTAFGAGIAGVVGTIRSLGFVGTLKAIGTGILGIFKNIGALIAAHPATAIIAGIALVIGSIITLWNQSEEFREYLKGIWEDVLKPMLEQIWDTLKGLWNEHLKPLIDSIGPFIKAAWELIVGVVRLFLPVLIPIITGIITLVGGVVKSLGEIVGDIVDILTGVITFLTGVFSGDWSKAWEGIKQIFVGVWEGLKDIIKVPLNALIGIFNGFIGGIARGYNAIVNAMSGVENPFTGHTITMKGINFKPIPYLANGGVIESPTVAMLGEYANARSNPEIAAPADLLTAIIGKENEAAMSAIIPLMRQLINTVDDKDFSVQIGDDTIAAAAQRGNKNYQRRTGQPLFGL